MALNEGASQIVVPSREETIAKYKRDYSLRDPSATTAVLGQVDIDARVFADQFLPVFDVARRAGDALTRQNQSFEDLANTWTPRGIPPLPALGSTGYVTISASSGGGPIFEGDEATEPNSGLRFKCLRTNLSYQDGDSVPIGAISTGPSTNLPPKTKLRWSTPRPGIGPTAVVFEQSEGDGLIGGRDPETVDEYNKRIDEAQANPPAAGNPSDVILKTEKTPGIPIEKAFVYGAIKGATTCAVAFVNKATLGASRVPGDLQRAIAESYVTGQLPSDIYYFPTVISQLQDVCLEVRWSRGVASWTDLLPWPARYATGAGRIVVQSSSSPTSFVLKRDNNDYTGITGPQVNQTIGFYRSGARRFSRKRIASVSGTGPWTITCSTTLNSTDLDYTPIVGQPCCPWSDSLDYLVTPFLKAFAELGPGEMVANANFLLDGQRQRRFPDSTGDKWPCTLTGDLLSEKFKIPQVSDKTFTQGAGATPTIGVPGVTVYLLSPGELTAFPKAA